MSVIADVFPEITAPKDVVRSMSKMLYFTVLFDRQLGKWVETLLQSEQEDLYNIS